MSKTYTVRLSENSDKILKWAEYDPQLWFETIVKNRADAAINEIYDIELKKALESKEKKSISSNKEKVVLESTLPNARQRTEIAQQEALKLMESKIND